MIGLSAHQKLGSFSQQNCSIIVLWRVQKLLEIELKDSNSDYLKPSYHNPLLTNKQTLDRSCPGC